MTGQDIPLARPATDPRLEGMVTRSATPELRFPRRRSTLTCSSIGMAVGARGRSGDAEPGSLASGANAMFLHQLRAPTVAAWAGAAIDSSAAAAIGAGRFLNAPQKAGADADRTVTRGHNAMRALLEVFADNRRRTIPFSGARRSLNWFGPRHCDTYPQRKRGRR